MFREGAFQVDALEYLDVERIVMRRRVSLQRADQQIDRTAAQTGFFQQQTSQQNALRLRPQSIFEARLLEKCAGKQAHNQMHVLDARRRPSQQQSVQQRIFFGPRALLIIARQVGRAVRHGVAQRVPQPIDGFSIADAAQGQSHLADQTLVLRVV